MIVSNKRFLMNYRNKRTATNRRLWTKYGITLEQYESMLKAQNGRCAICNHKPKKRKLGVDHEHHSNPIRVRGLLCYRCNKFLVASNTSETIEGIYRYLKRERILGL